jgi:hypothetical protein
MVQGYTEKKEYAGGSGAAQQNLLNEEAAILKKYGDTK